LLVDDLSVRDISFRLAGHDPRKLWFCIPLEVEDHFRNLMNAILKSELACKSIELEKRDFEPDEKSSPCITGSMKFTLAFMADTTAENYYVGRR